MIMVGKKKQWKDLSQTQRMAILLLGTLQVSLLAAALWDIYHRDQAEIDGSKAMWTAVSFFNFIGPIVYFVYGRKR